jgi:glycosyltransferase involved in cell wall biosynthesis
LRIYYYHNIDASGVRQKIETDGLPTHLLYGAVELERKGHSVIYHHPMSTARRWRLSLDTLVKVWRRRKDFDVLYATTFRGLELIVFLRAVGLFRRPVVCWHHQPVVRARKLLRELVARLFYRGFDELLFFSKPIVEDSLRSCKAPRGHLHIIPWGADLPFYDRLMAANTDGEHKGFVSTGKERRDMPTLVEAFNRTWAPLDIYICRQTNGFSYERLFQSLSLKPNVKVHYVQGDVVKDMALKVYHSQCAVICCQESNYTVGLTTVVEALALGIPMICSRNTRMPMNLETEHCGLLVDYRDVEGWQRAITYIQEHPDEARAMGRNGRRLAEKTYNAVNCGEAVEALLEQVMRNENKKKIQ